MQQPRELQWMSRVRQARRGPANGKFQRMLNERRVLIAPASPAMATVTSHHPPLGLQTALFDSSDCDDR